MTVIKKINKSLKKSKKVIKYKHKSIRNIKKNKTNKNKRNNKSNKNKSNNTKSNNNKKNKSIYNKNKNINGGYAGSVCPNSASGAVTSVTYNVGALKQCLLDSPSGDSYEMLFGKLGI